MNDDRWHVTRRIGRLLALLGLVLAFAVPGVTAAPAVHRAAIVSAGVDSHDGTVVKSGSTYVRVGTIYGCGYVWSKPGTPWCGIGASTAPSLSGPWSTPAPMFPPDSIDPYTGQSWQVECGGTGAGCFNGRLVQRLGWGANDGAWILFFNSPADYVRDGSNAYNAMGCNSVTGPCGPTAGGPYGSYAKPSLSHCFGNGDFGFITPPSGPPAMVCTMAGGGSLNEDQLNQWGNEGSGTGASAIGGITSIEAPGGWWDPGTQEYWLSFSDPYCGYCTGTGTGYATATSLYGPWTAQTDLTASPGAAPRTGRRDISATSCGGQPRTVFVADGQAYEWIDLWTGSPNETGAGVDFVPLTPTAPSGVPGDGGVWTPPLTLAC
ncbi:hypothetical protein [Streptacidiphilus sp. EB129]|uniref:hypothetical protein n=1 Tax=Streptacidiphilus sp. EB129 TaxID=3156262 RepID=UPI0035118DB9